LNEFKENRSTIPYTTEKNSQSRVENRETPPTSMVASEMLQNSGTLYTFAFISIPFNVVKSNLTYLTTKRCWFFHASGSMMETFA